MLFISKITKRAAACLVIVASIITSPTVHAVTCPSEITIRIKGMNINGALDRLSVTPVSKKSYALENIMEVDPAQSTRLRQILDDEFSYYSVVKLLSQGPLCIYQTSEKYADPILKLDLSRINHPDAELKFRPFPTVSKDFFITVNFRLNPKRASQYKNVTALAPIYANHNGKYVNNGPIGKIIQLSTTIK